MLFPFSKLDWSLWKPVLRAVMKWNGSGERTRGGEGLRSVDSTWLFCIIGTGAFLQQFLL